VDADEPYLWVEIERGDGPPVVVARGEFDAASAPELRAAVTEALADGVGVVLDLGAVGFIDSSGLRVVAEAVRLAKADGHPVSVSAMSDAVRRVFELTGVHALLDP